MTVLTMEHVASHAILKVSATSATSHAADIILCSEYMYLLRVVTPTPDTPYPGDPCCTLSEHVAGQYFNNLPANMTIEFLSWQSHSGADNMAYPSWRFILPPRSHQ